MSARTAPIRWALLVVPLWAVLVLGTRWEPVLRDGWSHVVLLHNRPASLAMFWDVAKGDYLEQNPRLGQLATLIGYALGPLHPIVTPIVELGLFALLTALALGRWPSVRRTDDALVALIVTAVVLACTPQIGPMLFYRPFTGNYLFGALVSVLWLAPYRFAVAEPWPARIWLAPLWLVIGAAAGMCNEHTGPAFLAMGALAALAVVRRDGRANRRRLPWMLAGLVGFAAGYAVLLTAPAQHLRYDGLADQASVVARIARRGFGGNVRIIEKLASYLAAALPLIGVAAIERFRLGPPVQPRGARWPAAVLALAGLVCVVTLLASPKIGPRLYAASVALLAAAIAGGVVAPLRTAWARRTCGVLAAGAVAYVAVQLVTVYRIVGPVWEHRLSALQHGAGQTVTLPAFPVPADRYFLGEDLNAPGPRQGLVQFFSLGGLVLAPSP